MKSIAPLGLLISGLVIGLATGPVFGDVGDVGPAWWHSLAHDEKTHVVQGMLDAYDEGFKDGSSRAFQIVAKRQHESGSWVLNNFLHQKFPTWPRPADAYAREITDFYATYPEEGLNVSTGEVIGCLADSPKWSCGELAKAANGG